MLRMTSFSTKLVLISLSAGVAFVGCGKTSGDELSAVSGSPSAGTAGVAGRAMLEIGGVGNLDSGDGRGGVGGTSAHPDVDCGQAGDSAGAAGTTEECNSPPPSVCTGGLHLTYYSSEVCVAHVCQWTPSTLECPEHCSNGACVGSTTEK